MILAPKGIPLRRIVRYKATAPAPRVPAHSRVSPMQFDMPTFSAVTVLASAATGYFLICVWLFGQNVGGLPWWGVAYLTGSAGLILQGARGVFPDLLSMEIGNAVLLAGYGIAWTAARGFDGRKASLPLALAGALVWLLACRVDAFRDELIARVILNSALTGLYALAAAYEIWRGRSGGVARLWAAGALAVHGLFFLGRIAWAPLLPFPMGGLPYDPSWATLFAAEGVLFLVVLALALVVMAKERAAQDARAAAGEG